MSAMTNDHYPGVYSAQHLKSLHRQQEMLNKLKLQKLKMLNQLHPGENYGL